MPYPARVSKLTLDQACPILNTDVPPSTNALGHTHSYPAMHVAHRLQVGRTGLSIPLGKLGCAVSTEPNHQAQGGGRPLPAVLFLSCEPVTTLT